MHAQKITDITGNPVLVSAVMIYSATNPNKALLNVEDFSNYVKAQASATLKLVVGKYTYDELKAKTEQITLELVSTLQPRIDIAGATVYSVTLKELNYAPEIAAAMLRKQAAQAQLDARHLIVKGAVDICTFIWIRLSSVTWY